MRRQAWRAALGMVILLLLPNLAAAQVSVWDPVKCEGSTICFRSPGYWLLHVNQAPGGRVFIGNYNMNTPVSEKNVVALRMALQGNPMPYTPLTPGQWLNQEIVAAQMSLYRQASSGSPPYYGLLGGQLACYGFNQDVTLSNGYIIAPESTIGELFWQSQAVFRERRNEDMPLLAAIWDWLNGEDPMGHCHISPQGEMGLP